MLNSLVLCPSVLPQSSSATPTPNPSIAPAAPPTLRLPAPEFAPTVELAPTAELVAPATKALAVPVSLAVLTLLVVSTFVTAVGAGISPEKELEPAEVEAGMGRRAMEVPSGPGEFGLEGAMVMASV